MKYPPDGGQVDCPCCTKDSSFKCHVTFITREQSTHLHLHPYPASPVCSSTLNSLLPTVCGMKAQLLACYRDVVGHIGLYLGRSMDGVAEMFKVT